MTHHVALDAIKLYEGSHSPVQAKKGNACLLEWVSIFAGVDYSDAPTCTSPVLGAFGRSLNDALPDDRRQRLIPFIPRLVGTAGDPEADERRVWMATDWLVRTYAPTWLRKAGLTAHADALVALPELTSTELATTAHPMIEAAKQAAWGAWGAWRADARESASRAAWAAAEAADWADWADWHYAAAMTAAAASYEVLDPLLTETAAELLDSALDLFERMCDYRTPVAVPA